MSAGATLSIIITLIVLIGIKVFNFISSRHSRLNFIKINLKHTIFIFFLLILSIILIFAFEDSFRYFNVSIFQSSFERISNNFQDSTGGSRFTIWRSILKEDNIFKYLFLGHGSTTIINGVIRRTHSGQLYLIYSFGFIAAFIYFYILFYKKNFRKWNSYIFVIPTVIGFTINTIMGEQKYVILHLLLMAIVSYSYYSKKRGVE
jgi:hypothetical protein